MSELRQLESALRDIRSELRLEERNVFARVRRDEVGELCLESSDAGLTDAALARLQPVVGSAKVKAVELPVAELRGRTAWVRASVAEVRRAPSHESEQVTQALQGEALEPLLHEGGWVLGRLPDGYVGWVRDWHLSIVDATEAQSFAARADARVGTSWAAVRSEPIADAEPCAEVILGTRVARGPRRGEWCRVELPGGRAGWLPDSDLRAGSQPWPREPEALLATSSRFLGVPYLWGGKSPKGFDCSGLVQFCFGLHGVALPRDADQQSVCGAAVTDPLERLAPCDLVFFGSERVTHVAVALGNGEYLHARGEVRRNAFAPGSPLHDAELQAQFLRARRILSP